MNPHDAADDSERAWRTAGGEGEESLQLPAFLSDPFGVLKRRWPWMLATALAGLVATAIAVWLWEPLYVAQATVLITRQEIPEEFIRSTVREDSISNIKARVAQVLSQKNLSSILERYELYPDSRDQQTQAALIARMRRNLDMESRSERGDSSMVYALSFADADPVRAAEVANAVAALFVEDSIANRTDRARQTTEFLKRELVSDERELRDHTQKMSEFRRANRGELPMELVTNLRKTDELARERDSLTAQIAQREDRIAELLGAGRLVTTRLGGDARGISVLKLADNADPDASLNAEMLDELRRQLARELAVHTEEHPNVVSLRRKVAEMEKVVAETEARAPSRVVSPEIAQMVESEKKHVDRMRSRLAEIESQRAELDARVDRTPIVGEQLAAFEQKEQILREEYLQTLRKVEAAELAESLESAQQGTRVSILDPARPPGLPDRPRWLVLVIGVGATLALTLGVAVLLELIDPVVVSAEQLEALAGRPVLGSLPRIA